MQFNFIWQQKHYNIMRLIANDTFTGSDILKKAIIASVIAALVLTGCSQRYESDKGQALPSSRIDVQDHSVTQSKAEGEQSSDLQADASGTVSLGPTSSEYISSGQASSSTTSSEISANGFAGLSNKKVCWGQGYDVNDRNQPISCQQFNEKYGKYDALFIDSAENNICLTFDEGYENGFTAPILDTLKEKQVKAIFFVTYDYCRRNHDLIRRMIDEGHTVANHSWGHFSMPELTVEKMQSEITKLHSYVQDNFGYSMTLFRPPMGEFSERSLAVTQSLGYKTLFWSFAYYDYDINKQPSAETALERITSAAHSSGIFLLHAISSTNSEVLGDVIDSFRASGYTLEVIK